MIRFHQTFGAHAGRIVTFDKDVVTIGRLPTCDVAFDARADIDASGQHAQARREQGVWHIVDSNSRNGTWLNGQRVSRAQLGTGDEVEFGRGGPRLRVEIPTTSARALMPAARAEVGLMPTAQWGADDFLPTSTGGAPPAPIRPPELYPPAPGSGSGPSYRPPPAYQSPPTPSLTPVHASPTGPASYAPTPSPMQPAMGAQASVRQPTARAAPRKGLGLGVAAALGVAALVFAALATGVLVWRLRGGSGSHAPPRPTLPPGAAAQMLMASVGPTTYLVAAHPTDGTLRVLCTAFAVRSDLVATSGRCVKLIQQTRDSGVAVDLMRDGLPAPIGIASMYLHPSFDASASGASHDVGVIRTAGPLAAVLPLPTLEELQALVPGGAAYVVAFAATPIGNVVPSPVVYAGTLGTPMHFDGTPSDFDGAQLVPHSAPVEAGGSGAPVLDATGLLIAIHASEARTTPSLSVRVDVLLALLAGLGS